MTQTHPASAAPTFAPQQKLYTVIGVLLVLLLASLDQTIVATAGPIIQRDLHITPALYTWLTTAYLVTGTVLIPTYGAMSDRFGRKPILLVAITLFLIGSSLSGLAWDPLSLIAFRAFQGLGAAGLLSTAFTIVADLFSPAERGRYQGLFTGVFGLSSVLGPLAGGLIADHLGWRWVFYVNVPIGLIALAFITARMPRLKPAQPEGPPAPIDFAGTFWLVVAVVPLLLGVSLGRTRVVPGVPGYAWLSWQTLGLFALALVGAAAFVLTERRAAQPIIRFSLFRDRTYLFSSAAVFVLGAGFLASVLFLPLFMVNVVGLSATGSGLTTTPLTLALVVASILAGLFTSRFLHYQPLMLFALALLLVGFGVIGFTLTPASTQLEVGLKMALVGFGLGLQQPLYTLAVQNTAPPDVLGAATSTITFVRQIGLTIGTAGFNAVFVMALGANPSKETYTSAIERVYQGGLVLVALGLLFTLFIPNLPLSLRKGGAAANSG